jgi:hypothetical protein
LHFIVSHTYNTAVDRCTQLHKGCQARCLTAAPQFGCPISGNMIADCYLSFALSVTKLKVAIRVLLNIESM